MSWFLRSYDTFLAIECVLLKVSLKNKQQERNSGTACSARLDKMERSEHSEGELGQEKLICVLILVLECIESSQAYLWVSERQILNVIF